MAHWVTSELLQPDVPVQPRTPKRVYSPAALEQWFERLCDPWEHYFSEDEIARARTIYREAEVRELNLDPETLIVHSRRGSQDVYAVVEWENGKLAVRSGIADKQEGRALAAAGIYEAEELLTAEISPLTPDQVVEKAPRPRPAPPPEPELPPAQRPHLKLRLTPTPQGLRLQGHWLEGAKERPAFASLKEGSGVEASTPQREMLIMLTAKARRVGFVFRPGKGDFILREALRIPPFVRSELPKWRSTFAVEADPRLEVFGEGVRNVRLKAQARQAGTGNRDVSLDWSAYIDGKVLERSHAHALLRRAGQVIISPELGLLRVDASQAPELGDYRGLLEIADGAVPPYLLFSLFQNENVPVELSPELLKWREGLLQPPSRNGTLPPFLRPYQKRGVAWMSHLGTNGCHCLLADEMGLGKTVQVLSLLAHEGPMERSSLIVCPASVVPVWQAEVARFFPAMPVKRLQTGSDWTMDTTPALWVASYTQLRRHRHLLPDQEFVYAVLDEAQFIKNPDAKVTQVCQAIRSQRRIAVTGTPLENRELDLWTIFRFLMPGLLGNRKRLEAKLATNTPEVRQQLRRQVAPFILRRTKAEVATELPPKIEAILNCPLTTLQEREYRRLAREGVASFGEDISKTLHEHSMSFFALLTRLRQVCCDPGLLPWLDSPPSQSGKINTLLEKLGELVSQGRKAVIFSQFASFLKRVEAAIRAAHPTLPIHMLTGQTTDRSRPVAGFQNTKGPAIILVSLKAGGTGITLSAADYVFLLDPWWNPAVEAQAIDRVHRIGQDKTVFVYRLITPGTVEERVEKLKHEKRELFDATVGNLADVSEMRNYYTSLSALIGADLED